MDPIPERLERIDAQRLRRDLFHLASDPLPQRTLNTTRPGQDRCTLYEADDYLTAQLEAAGWSVAREGVEVQAFRRDAAKPIQHQYSPPAPEDPVYTAYNLYARRRGSRHPEQYVVAIAHKDSQSWCDSPGAYDNGAGTVAVLEIARALADYEPDRSLWLVWCNEEHTPWTSVTVAEGMAADRLDVRGVVNVDSIGGRGPAEVEAGRKTHVTRYTSPEGEALAARTASLNRRFGLGLETSSYASDRPNDDDGSFIKAGIPAAVLHIGSYPYADADYHQAGDVPEKVDFDLLARSARLSLALLLDLDRQG